MQAKRSLIKARIWTLALIQMTIALVIALCFLGFSGEKAALAALLAAILSVLPNLYFATRLFRYMGAQQIKAILYSFYMGEAVKFLLVAVLCVLFIRLFNVAIAPFFISFVILQMCSALTPLLMPMNREMKAL